MIIVAAFIKLNSWEISSRLLEFSIFKMLKDWAIPLRLASIPASRSGDDACDIVVLIRVNVDAISNSLSSVEEIVLLGSRYIKNELRSSFYLFPNVDSLKILGSQILDVSQIRGQKFCHGVTVSKRGKKKKKQR